MAGRRLNRTVGGGACCCAVRGALPHISVTNAASEKASDRGTEERLQTVKVLPGAAEHQGSFLILIREVQR